jgi:Domain of unknown function (DUF3395)
MEAIRSLTRIFVVFVFVATGAAVFAPRSSAQDQTWMVVRADYGHKDQRTDVTDLVQDLISRGGVNGRVVVNNQTMGGDPAVGAEKYLHIFARNRRGEEHEFDFKEGSSFDAAQFVVPPPPVNDWDDRSRHGDRDDRGRPYGDRGDANGLWIIRAYYGVQHQQANVTDIVRGLVRDSSIQVNVTNRSMGGDPAPGADKTLIVVYRYQGREAAAAVREGDTLSIP